MFCTPTVVCKKIKKMENDFHIFFTHYGKRFPHKIKAIYSKRHAAVRRHILNELYEYKTKNILCIRKGYLLCEKCSM